MKTRLVVRAAFDVTASMAGRGGAIRLKGAQEDILVVVLYFPVRFAPEGDKIAGALLDWTRQLIERCGARTVAIVVCDANDGLGLCRDSWRDVRHAPASSCGPSVSGEKA